MILAPPGGAAEVISESSQTVHISGENGMKVSRFLFHFVSICA